MGYELNKVKEFFFDSLLGGEAGDKSDSLHVVKQLE